MIKWIKSMINKWKYRKVLKQVNSSNLFVDIGSTSVKMYWNGKMITFKSSVRLVQDMNIITPGMSNWIMCNGQLFIIGESTKSNEVCRYKVDRQHLSALILYGIKLLGIDKDSNFQISLLVPYDEVKFKKQLENKINGLYDTNIGQISLTLDKLFIEGESSSVYIKTQYKVDNSIVVLNIGGKTCDTIALNSNGERQHMVSINMGVMSLLANMLKFTNAPTSSALSNWLNEGYKWTKQEQIHLREVGNEFMENIYNDVVANVLAYMPPNTKIYCVGGGSLILKESINLVFKDYDVKVLDEYESIWSDIFGALLLSEVELPRIENEEDRPKSKYEEFCEMVQEGADKEVIISSLNIALQTYRNYLCKYNKQLSN